MDLTESNDSSLHDRRAIAVGANHALPGGGAILAPCAAGEFWTELNVTLDEFFAVIGTSKERLAELSEEIVKRDRLITLLEAQNGALRARLGLADGVAQERRAPVPMRTTATSDRETLAASLAAAPIGAGPSGPGPAHSIWHRLSNLERGT